MEQLKILIADDDKSIRALYDKALAEGEFEKRFATDGNEALDVYAIWKPDILLLDVYMPVMTGYSVLKKIRVEFEDRRTAVIMSTNVSDQEHIKDFVLLGIQGYIIKPFNFKEVGVRVMQYYMNFIRERAG